LWLENRTDRLPEVIIRQTVEFHILFQLDII